VYDTFLCCCDWLGALLILATGTVTEFTHRSAVRRLSDSLLRSFVHPCIADAPSLGLNLVCLMGWADNAAENMVCRMVL
jgi:hypothetical protein